MEKIVLVTEIRRNPRTVGTMADRLQGRRCDEISCQCTSQSSTGFVRLAFVTSHPYSGHNPDHCSHALKTSGDASADQPNFPSSNTRNPSSGSRVRTFFSLNDWHERSSVGYRFPSFCNIAIRLTNSIIAVDRRLMPLIVSPSHKVNQVRVAVSEADRFRAALT